MYILLSLRLPFISQVPSPSFKEFPSFHLKWPLSFLPFYCFPFRPFASIACSCCTQNFNTIPNRSYGNRLYGFHNISFLFSNVAQQVQEKQARQKMAQAPSVVGRAPSSLTVAVPIQSTQSSPRWHASEVNQQHAREQVLPPVSTWHQLYVTCCNHEALQLVYLAHFYNNTRPLLMFRSSHYIWTRSWSRSTVRERSKFGYGHARRETMAIWRSHADAPASALIDQCIFFTRFLTCVQKEEHAVQRVRNLCSPLIFVSFHVLCNCCCGSPLQHWQRQQRSACVRCYVRSCTCAFENKQKKTSIERLIFLRPSLAFLVWILPQQELDRYF